MLKANNRFDYLRIFDEQQEQEANSHELETGQLNTFVLNRQTDSSKNLIYLSQKGRVFGIRRFKAADEKLITDFLSRLLPVTLRNRYLSPIPRLEDAHLAAEIKRILDAHGNDGTALLATIRYQGQEEVIGLAELLSDSANRHEAEVALVVRDDYQGESIGYRLSQQLLQLAVSEGISLLRGVMNAENRVVLRLFNNMGLPGKMQVRSGTATLLVDISKLHNNEHEPEF
ncbi:MAG TPA: GNAT family N-acetyltransferase [Chloroflexia bacterium]|nr:GNAT family N-acetyltransferase [Chloroflexia bacterium]